MSPKPDIVPKRSGLRRFSIAILFSSVLILLAMTWPGLAESTTATAAAASQTPAPTESALPTQAATATAAPQGGLDQGSLLLHLNLAGYQQLAWYSPRSGQLQYLPQRWDDAGLVASPDGAWLAFASNRSGAWDLYVMDLNQGRTERLSEDDAYQGNPSWSPAGDWLAYEQASQGNLEIYMRPLDGSLDPVPLSNHAAADYEPAWRPGAQEIAFVSTRSGQAQIWLLDLEQSGAQRFQLLQASPHAQRTPAWSPDGRWLAWSQQDESGWRVYLFDTHNDGPARPLGMGQRPSWSPDGELLLVTLSDAQHSYLSAYTRSGGLGLAPLELPGSLIGLAWAEAPLGAAFQAELQPLSTATASNAASLEALDSVHAPNAELHAAARPAFEALRQRAAQLLGWDALASLDNAALPLTGLLPPGRGQDWLYTGRAFELHAALEPAGWLAAVREDYAGQTYWRIYLRSAAADGGLGAPLRTAPWDFDRGEPMAAIPDGNWIDFSALAAAYGFERPAALPDWPSYYPGTLFNQFVYRQGLSWDEAMLQLYTSDEVSNLLGIEQP